jgi:thiol-disulfide isomerase/thioredoxin
MFKELENDTLKNEVDTGDLTFVQFSASWCGNCRMLKPTFKRLGQESSANFLIVDAEKYPDSRNLAQVTNLPTFAAFRNGELVKQVQTNKPALLKEFINEITNN